MNEVRDAKIMQYLHGPIISVLSSIGGARVPPENET